MRDVRRGTQRIAMNEHLVVFVVAVIAAALGVVGLVVRAVLLWKGVNALNHIADALRKPKK